MAKNTFVAEVIFNSFPKVLGHYVQKSNQKFIQKIPQIFQN